MTLTPEAAARRRALGIPVHETEAEHEFHDGYCCCGEKSPAARRRERTRHYAGGTGRTAGRINLDVIERNEVDR